MKVLPGAALLLLLSPLPLLAAAKARAPTPAVDPERSDQVESVAVQLIAATDPERRARLAQLTVHVEAQDELGIRLQLGKAPGRAHLMMTRGLYQLAEVLSQARAADLLLGTHRAGLLPGLLRDRGAPGPDQPAGLLLPDGFLDVPAQQRPEAARLASSLLRDALAYLVGRAVARLPGGAPEAPGPKSDLRSPTGEMKADEALACTAVRAGFSPGGLLMFPTLLAGLDGDPRAPLGLGRGDHRQRLERLEAVLPDCPSPPWWPGAQPVLSRE